MNGHRLDEYTLGDWIFVFVLWSILGGILLYDWLQIREAKKIKSLLSNNMRWKLLPYYRDIGLVRRLFRRGKRLRASKDVILVKAGVAQELAGREYVQSARADYTIENISHPETRLYLLKRWFTYHLILHMDIKHTVPTMVLDYLPNNKFQKSRRTKLNRIQLEGDFNSYFELWIAPGSQIDALSIFTPDIMEKFRFYHTPFDAVFDGEEIYIISKGWRKDLSTILVQTLEYYEDILKTVSKIKKYRI